LSWLRSIIARFRGDDPRREQRYFIPYPVAGMHLSADDTLSLGAVWACIDAIARSLGPARWCIYAPDQENPKKRELLLDDPKAWLLNTRPNPEMTAIGWREAMLFQAIPFGNSYSEIVRDAAGRTVQLWPLLSDRMRPRRDPATWALVYEYTQASGEIIQYQPRDIFHLRGPGMWGLMGDNVVARAAKTIGLAAAQERFGAAYFGQGAQPGGVLEYPNKLSPEVYERLKKDWADKRKGPENAHKPMILEEGMKWQSTSFDPQKSQMVESRKFSVEEIARWFGVPLHKIQQLDHATFSNIEHASIEFVRDTLTPWATRLCQEADFKLFPQTRAPWVYTEIDLRPLTRGDAQSRALAQASWRQNGIMSANEIRAMEGLDDCGDDGDVLLVQSNMTTVEQLLQPPAPPPGLVAPSLPAPDESNGADDEDLDPETDDDEVIEPSTVATSRRALIAALTGTLERYGRRLANQKARRSHREALDAFRTEQAEVMVAELLFFDAFAREVVGRSLTAADLGRAAAIFENGGHPEIIVCGDWAALPA
jgi:HK97 family phage portal protein